MLTFAPYFKRFNDIVFYRKLWRYVIYKRPKEPPLKKQTAHKNGKRAS